MTTGELSPEEERELHERWISELEVAWAPLFEAGLDGLYIYIDDVHKTCNEQMAKLWDREVEGYV